MQALSPTDNSHETARRAAARVALAAWRAIEHFYRGSYTIHEKVDGPCTEADKLADGLIVEQLQRIFPGSGDAFLTEESEADQRRLSAPRVWIIDPIDGTKDFIRRNGNFALHIGLVERQPDGHYEPVAAVVYKPIGGLLYSAVRGGGAWRKQVEMSDEDPADWGERLRVTDRAELPRMRSAVSNANRESRLTRLIQSLNLEDYWHVGSLGVKLTQIAEGRAELYINLGLGKAKEWDTCAPLLILQEAGGLLTDLQGNPLQFNDADFVHRHGLLASNGPLHAELIERVRAFLVDNPHPTH